MASKKTNFYDFKKQVNIEIEILSIYSVLISNDKEVLLIKDFSIY